MSQKIGRNDVCPCGSGKKYKKCCKAGPIGGPLCETIDAAKTRIYTGPSSDPASAELDACMQAISEKFPDFTVINVSNQLNTLTYREIQLNNMHMPHILIAERNPSNERVFTDRNALPFDNIMVMYHGHYRITCPALFSGDFSSAVNMIK